MSQEFYSYLQGMHSFIEAQERRIQSLEKIISELQKEMKSLKERPPINIERIDYKFDQLKVETLEGTLNIGLNPNDLENIDDFAVDNQKINAPVSPKNFMKKAMEIEDEMYRYLESDLPNIIAEVQMSLNVPADESYISFIKEDIKKQLPNRIDYYLKQFDDPSNQNHGQDRSLNDEVINQLKIEIRNGVHAFISHLPEHVKGMKKE
ncbi:spore germination protein GerPC [Cytobacillus solani]|uniref:Spore gernimation protein n=1 Tax=Cytobacillus solani TaxID=1637975 RepID=A0A0Q3SGQ9_9BACI|nr:spore germination protein GerPC [Cytobacillus solani]KOP81689.1 spore gernimation protein [Bacillus sp. FJAT-21945]KQL18628.1 spore gernimation protein [Cytobacillus solani]USK56608.1 spore germination protein GerPC [Cytobacillus solani]